MSKGGYVRESTPATSGIVRSSESKVHHTLPIATVMACGLARSSLAGIQVTYDLSKTTCQECVDKLSTPTTDRQAQEAIEAAGWLRSQGEDFASLKKLVEEVNFWEGRMVGDDPPFGPKTRTQFVARVCNDLDSLQAQKGASGGAKVPAGGLSHETTNWLVRKVRGAITDLRAGQAWPDDARRVAAELELRLDNIFGSHDLPPSLKKKCDP